MVIKASGFKASVEPKERVDMTTEEEQKKAEEEAKAKAEAEALSRQPDPAKELEEVKKKLQEKETNLIAQIEKSNRLEALMQTYASSAPVPIQQRQDASPYASMGIDPAMLLQKPEEVLGKVVQYSVNEATRIMEQRYREAELMKEQLRRMRDSFYKDNPELVGFEKIVGIVENDLRLQFPNVPYTNLISEIANKAKTEVSSLKTRFGNSSVTDPLALEASGGNRNPAAAEPPLEKDDFSEYMNSRREFRTQKSVAPVLKK